MDDTFISIAWRRLQSSICTVDEKSLSWLACTYASQTILPPAPAALQQEGSPVPDMALLQSLTINNMHEA
jgi:hypothetical protein